MPECKGYRPSRSGHLLSALVGKGLILFSLSFISIVLNGQNNSVSTGSITGVPFIRNYTPEEYGAHNQNWAVVQDHRGVMYFGNNHGVLEYDGVSWRTIQTPDNNIIRSLAIGEDGRIYVGSYGDFGYLAPDSTNQLQYISLLPKLDTQYHHFPDVWQTLATRTGIYFVTPKLIFRWNGEQMRVWVAQSQFHVGFEVNKEFFVRQWGVGLMQVVSDSLTVAPLGEYFGMERIMAMLPYASGNKTHILFATRNNGLLLYDGISIEPFRTEADKLFIENQIYCAAQLTGGQYAFGTLQNGVIIIDKNGRLLHHLNKATGLQDETIWYLYPDRQDGLWIGMHLGISRAETNSPLTYFGEKEGLEGSVLDIVRHNGLLYAATSMGLYYLDEKRDAKFHLVSGVSPQGWALLPFDDILLAGTFDGVYEVRGSTGRLIDSVYAMSFARSQTDSNRVFVGMHTGLKSLYYDNGKWRDEGRIGEEELEILRIYESPKGVLWLTARYNPFVRIDFSKGFSKEPVITAFDTLSGLPDGDRNIAFNSIKGLRFGTSRGIYRFDEKEERFFPDTSLVKGLGEADFFSLTEDQQGNIWLVNDGGSGVALKESGYYSWDKNPFLRIVDLDAYYAYPDPALKGIAWLGTIDRVIRYDNTVKHNHAAEFSTLIRQVITNEDSLLYGGAGNGPAGSFTLRYNYKSLRFVYAAPSFDDESKTEYQYILEGYDAQWSNWTTETYKDYTGLPKGNYRFLVRSKNIYQQLGATASIDFKILPPFYLSWWTYILYAIIITAIVLALWRMNLKRVRKHHLQELKQLELDKLKELDQLKSRFFADISHEFRTPLTLILGPVDNLLSSHPTPDQARNYQLIKRNAQRLLRLINQLLDLSKLEAGKMKLELKSEDIIPMLKSVMDSFDSFAQSKKVILSFKCELPNAVVKFDRDKMEQVITNLVSNAIKFTPEEGKVEIGVSQGNGDMLKIEVSDTGSGISKEQLPYVFDRFYQGKEANHIDEVGSGIGLALAKELVDLHNGKISANSSENHGATFTILLPLDKTAVHSIAPVYSKNGNTLVPDESINNSVVALIGEQELTSDNTLLLVEDNTDMRAFIRETLSGPYRIIEANDGQDGVEKAFEYIPDIIISDVMMPRKDGLELCHILKSDERTSHIPIILLTAKADIESRLAGLERGANDYLAKPFNREELMIRTRNLLELRKRLWERYGAILPPPSPTKNKDIQIEDVFLQKVRVVVEENLSESDFEIDQLSRLIGMSRSQLFRKIKALTGQSPSIFIRTLRLQKAKKLLETTEMNVSEVAYQVGFSSPAYFSDMFTETYGTRPSQLKKYP